MVEQAGKYTVTLMQKDGTELETEFFAYSTKLPELPKEPESNNSILIIIAGVLIGIIVIVGGYFLLKKKQKQLKAKV